MEDERLLQAIEEVSEAGKLPCKIALALAARLAVPPGRIGALCNRHAIRIVNCQLGCFGANSKRKPPGEASAGQDRCFPP